MISLLRIEKELRKGVLEILLLNIISTDKLYGYEIMKKIHEESHGFFDLKEGTLYPVLYRLEDEECIESIWESAESRRGARRKYYLITEKGKVVLETYTKAWDKFSKEVNMILNGGQRHGKEV